MTPLRVLLSRMLDLLLRRRREARLSEEIQTHLAMLTQDCVRMALGARPRDIQALVLRTAGIQVATGFARWSIFQATRSSSILRPAHNT